MKKEKANSLNEYASAGSLIPHPTLDDDGHSEKLKEPDLKSWALVELFGRQRIVGYLSQQTFGTGVLFRVDVPDLTKDGKTVRRIGSFKRDNYEDEY